MGFFDYYLMPIAIQPIYTPLTYTGGIRKNRGFSLRREILVCTDFLASEMENGNGKCRLWDTGDRWLILTQIINEIYPDVSHEINRTLSLSIILLEERETRKRCIR